MRLQQQKRMLLLILRINRKMQCELGGTRRGTETAQLSVQDSEARIADCVLWLQPGDTSRCG